MRFVSIDIETTGLDPNLDQILEVAAIRSWDGAEKLWPIKWERISGHPFALHRNYQMLDPNRVGIKIGELEQELKNFLEPQKNGVFVNNKYRFVVAGKNFGKFDWQFLNRWIDMPNLFFHRALDPAHYWIRREDEHPPSLETCCERAGLPMEGIHSALTDARLVHRLLVKGWQTFNLL